jgi:Flp pilus assembly secretin CpaC
MILRRGNNRNRSAFFIAFLVVWMLFINGCGDFFSEKPTELESRKILRHLSELKTPVQDPYKISHIRQTPPKIIKQKVGGADEFKLFYFCRYHTSDKLQKIINDQYATKLFNEKGKSTNIMDYTVSSNPATNQLIVRCPLLEDVESVLESLEHIDVPPIQVKVDCLISEVYADVTMDWETTLKIEDLFGTNLSLGGKISEGVMLPIFPGAALRDAARATFGLKAGYVQSGSGDEFSALVDLLVSRGYLKILMNPTLEVVNGQTAEILTKEHVPLDEIQTVTPESLVIKTTQYVDVIDSLKVTPHVYGDGYIGLDTEIVIGSKSTPEGVKQTPIVTERKVINKENRIRQGESLIIGGIRKTEKRSVVRGVPFLKDLPGIGILFSSKDFEERGKEVLFILTPTISTGGIPSAKMVEDIRKIHTNVRYERGLGEVLFDPLGGFGDNEGNEVNNEFNRVQAEIRQARTPEEINQAKQKLLETSEAEKQKVMEQKGLIKEQLQQMLENLNAED